MVHIDCEKSLRSDFPELKIQSDDTSWNVKDEHGKKLADECIVIFILLVITIVLFCVYCSTRKLPILFGAVATLAVVITVGAVAVVDVVKDPMTILYSVSQYATRLKKTPPVMDALIDEPVAKALEDNYETIKAEVCDMLDNSDGTLTRDTYAGNNVGIGKDVHIGENGEEVGWKIINVHMCKNVNKVAKSLMPTFTRLMQEYGVISSVISVLPAKTQIPPHVGYSSLVKRLMLAIEVPESSDRCYLCVNGEKVTWVEGKTLLWDDTYLHSVWNETDQRRIVLYMDVRRSTGNAFVDWLGQQIMTLFENSKVVKDEIARTEIKKKIGNIDSTTYQKT